MDLSGFAQASKSETPRPDTFTAVVVRSDGSGLWVVPLGDDPRHPIGPCKGGWTASGTRVPPGALVMLAHTPDDSWVAAFDNPALAINDATLAPFQNPSFETPTSNPDLPGFPDGWSDFWAAGPSKRYFGDLPVPADRYRRTLEEGNAAHGLRCLRVDVNGVNSTNESFEWNVPLGASIEISAYARGAGPEVPELVAVVYSNAAGSYAGPFGSGNVQQVAFRTFPGADWLRYRGVVTLPPTHSKANLFLEVRARNAGAGTVWLDNVDADLVEIDPTAEHQDYIRRATLVLGGGGHRLVTAGGNVSWSQPFTIVAAGGRSTTEAVDGRFDIAMPAAGTVIPVHSSSGRTSYTVAGGVIALSANQAVWYELPLGGPAASQPGNFHILGNSSADGFTVPPHWILIAHRGSWGASNHAPEYLWGDGMQQDPWRTPAFNSGWLAGTVAPRFRKNAAGEIRMKGRVRSGAGSAFTLPGGYAPAETHRAIVPDGLNAPALLTVTSAGVVTTAGNNTDHSIETTFVAEQ